MKKGYRIPTITELTTQDFEFEYSSKIAINYKLYHDGDFTFSKPIKYKTFWNKIKVWWHPRTKEEAFKTSYYHDGTSISWVVNPLMDNPFHEETMIKNKSIRVKI